MKNIAVKNIFRIITLLMVLYLTACGTSTSSRYIKTDDNTKELDSVSIITSGNELKETFDITPYKTEIVVPAKKTYTVKNDKNIWFDYGSPEIDVKPKSLVGTDDGFRVQVLVTDNLDEANTLKADVYFSKSADEVYVDFEPPFYKVKVGDFVTEKSAEDLKFKLTQLGYKDSKVIKDKINIFK